MKYLLNFYELRKTKFNRYNLGDLASSPLLYFDFPNVQVQHLNFEDDFLQYPRDSHIIIGGGGILHNSVIRQYLDYFTGKKIIWGAGGYRFIEEYKDQFDLIGVRDWYAGKKLFVPCVSCISPLFDIPAKTGQRYVAYFGHKYKMKNCGIMHTTTLVDSIAEFPTKLEYIKRVEKILITSSYHGAYWALLLHKVVWTLGPIWFQKKVMTLKYREPKFGMLEEFRAINQEFYNKVMNIL